MAWQPIDFQGIASFERTLADQLEQYLDEKETQVSRTIAESIHTQPNVAQPTLPSGKMYSKLSDGVETFTRKVSQASNGPEIKEDQWKETADTVNATLWEYVELLQGIVVELFQQVDQVGIEQWKSGFLRVVESIKESLSHRMEDLKWAIKRLESQLWDYKKLSSDRKTLQSRIADYQHLWKSLIDNIITKNIEKNQKFLNFRYQNFLHRYEEYGELNSEIEKKMEKFANYHILASLEPEEQTNFKRLYRLLKLWKANKQAKALPDAELVRVVRFALTPARAATIFKNYFHALQHSLFSQSRLLKQSSPDADYLDDLSLHQQLELRLMDQRYELHTLGATISAYRSFLLDSDPNPYVRTRGGFSEWIVGHEPSQTKSLVDQEYDMERLDFLYIQFLNSLKPSKEDNPLSHQEIYKQVEVLLRDMSQPLASSGLIHHRGEELVEKLNQLNELSTRDPDVVKNMTPLLSRAMRADWKYHVMHEIPLFIQLFAVHMQILPQSTDRQHSNRLKHFRKLLHQLQGWVKDKSTLSHMNEVELDINDIKGYLQDFLAQLQRAFKDPQLFTKEKGQELINTTSQQLLEYRYLFGYFFHDLRQTEIDERLLRNQFLFVDQYFETIENKLVEMKAELKRK